ncbi:cupin domain-containing protein [Roseovarius sp. D0-M9]|uniref:cupin domain-containing protein n=1 Tax=Roseovarius sp. D0-M9 TaxID=3127117 RepID=UPI0030105761
MSEKTNVKRIIPDGAGAAKLEAWPEMDPAALVSGTPVQSGCFHDEVEAEDYSVGIWECTAFVDQPGPYPVDEFMLLLEGSVEMAMPDGTAFAVGPGEAFIIPKGLECQWKMPGTVRKIFMILDGSTPTSGAAAASNDSLHRITVPALAARPVPEGAVVERTTCFVNHDGRMRVHIDNYPAPLIEPVPCAGRHLVHVLEGAVKLGDAPDMAFGKGDSFYLMPGSAAAWRIEAGTRLLTATCDLDQH